jgi:ribosomal protein S18 acetylase RimI-like enzyme
MNMVEDNLYNLFSLWQTAAKPKNGYFERDHFRYCHINGSDWPNRLWFTHEITKNAIKSAKQQVYPVLPRLTIPYWDILDGTPCHVLEEEGFKVKSMQIGMSLQVKNRSEKKLRLQLERVRDSHDAKLWAHVFPQAFGYRISEEVLAKSYDQIEYYLASHLGTPVGTAIVYQTGVVVGVHGVGIVPERRRQGFAEEMMEYVLDRAVSLKASYVTLQASAMGRGLYDRLGFKENFTIRNYILDTGK